MTNFKSQCSYHKNQILKCCASGTPPSLILCTISKVCNTVYNINRIKMFECTKTIFSTLWKTIWRLIRCWLNDKILTRKQKTDLGENSVSYIIHQSGFWPVIGTTCYIMEFVFTPPTLVWPVAFCCYNCLDLP